jgi:hypothetical protein
MSELEELRLAYAECNRQRNELLAKLKRISQILKQDHESMRMPKVGDAVICTEDCSVGVIADLTAGESLMKQEKNT